MNFEKEKITTTVIGSPDSGDPDLGEWCGCCRTGTERDSGRVCTGRADRGSCSADGRDGTDRRDDGTVGRDKTVRRDSCAVGGDRSG